MQRPAAITLILALEMATLAFSRPLQAQAVIVTARLDTNTLAPGAATLLTVQAQVAPALRPEADRIFSWYIDLVTTDPAVASPQHDALERPASDNDPLLASAGFADGPVRRAIRDTFLLTPGAGVADPVVLFRVPILANAPGTTSFRVRAGTGADPLAADFLVAPIGGGEPWTGGDYSAALATLTVRSPSTVISLSLSHNQLPDGRHRVQLTYNVPVGHDAFVETANPAEPTAPWTWTTLPGGPHNLGTCEDLHIGAARLYRVRAVPR